MIELLKTFKNLPKGSVHKIEEITHGYYKGEHQIFYTVKDKNVFKLVPARFARVSSSAQ